jgi:hypothetical protein
MPAWTEQQVQRRGEILAEVFNAVNPLIAQFQSILGFDSRTFGLIWHFYLYNALPPTGMTSEFWASKRAICAVVETPAAESRDIRVPWAPLCEVSLRLHKLPCSEAAVERVFSHLRLLFGDYRHSLAPELVDAMLVIRFNHESATNNNAKMLTQCLERAVSENGGDPALCIGFNPEKDQDVLDDPIERADVLADCVREDQRRDPRPRSGETHLQGALDARNPIKE